MHHRSFPARLALTVVMALAALAMPPAAAACSCAMPGPMAEVRGDPESAVFTAVVDQQDGRGYPVTVTRWFQGGGILEPRVWFVASSFSGDGASCGVAPLPIGSEWIFVAYRTEGMYGTGLCSPHAQLSTPDGQAMLADAIQTFGGGQPSSPGPPSDGPSPGGPFDPATMVGYLGPLLVILALGIGLLFGIVGVLRRTRVGRD